jgi:hypothetical protein
LIEFFTAFSNDYFLLYYVFLALNKGVFFPEDSIKEKVDKKIKVEDLKVVSRTSQGSQGSGDYNT